MSYVPQWVGDLRQLDGPIGFGMRFCGGALAFVAENVRPYRFLTVDRFELHLTQRGGALDLSQGIRRFHTERTRLVELRVTLDEEELRSLLHRATGGRWIDLQLSDGELRALLDLGDGLYSVAALGHPRGARLELELGRISAFDWHDTPLSARLQEFLDGDGSTRAWLDGRQPRRVVLELLPLLIELTILRDGWQFPEIGALELTELSIDDGRLRLGFRDPAAGAPAVDERPTDEVTTAEAIGNAESDPQSDPPPDTDDAEFDELVRKTERERFDRFDGAWQSGEFELALELLEQWPALRREDEAIFAELLLASAHGVDRVQRLAHRRLQGTDGDRQWLAHLLVSARFFHHTATALSYLSRLEELARERGDRPDRSAALLTLARLHADLYPAMAHHCVRELLRVDASNPRAAALCIELGMQDDIESLGDRALRHELSRTDDGVADLRPDDRRLACILLFEAAREPSSQRQQQLFSLLERPLPAEIEARLVDRLADLERRLAPLDDSLDREDSEAQQNHETTQDPPPLDRPTTSETPSADNAAVAEVAPDRSGQTTSEEETEEERNERGYVFATVTRRRS
ncbi:MAG: hypothetical protein KC609_00070 [Myxococcales bacterium]|nr:hypothetical protein [Myxococcales bacterium]